MNLLDKQEKMYKVGFYVSEKGAQYYKSFGKRVSKIGVFWAVYQDELYPMTHTQAMTFKSKMMNPANHFLYEVEPEETV